MKDYDKIIKNIENGQLNNTPYKIADEEYYNLLFKKIHNEESVDLSSTYFDGFSLDKYREKYNLHKTDVIRIHIDKAMLSFFDGRINAVDFSYIEFIPNDITAGISFNNSIFCGGKADFSYSKFGESDLSFDDCVFKECTLKLIYCDIIKDLTFINAIKEKSPFVIYGVSTNNGDVDFSELNSLQHGGIDGEGIFIEKCIFNNSIIKFENSKSDGNGDYVIFIDNKFNLKDFSFDNSYFYGIVFYKCAFDCNVSIKDCACEYFILQECVLRDVFKIVHEQLPTNYGIQFCFLNTIFNGYFDMDNDIPKNFLRNQKKICIAEDIDYEDIKNNRFFLDDTSYLEKAMQTNNLSEIFSKNGKFNQQDRAYSLSRRYRNFYRVQEKIYSLKSIYNEKEYKGILHKCGLYIKFSLQLMLSLVVFAFEFILLDTLCGNYATNPLKFLVWLIVIIAGFGTVISFSCDLNNIKLMANITNSMPNINLAMFISLTNFFQVELMDNNQEYTLYIISMTEKILGMIMLALFTVSYTRKVIK